MIRIFKSKVLSEQLTLTQLDELVNDFRQYKETGRLPDTFGRDALYDHAYTYPLVKAEQVAHIHMADGDHPWPVWQVQFKRTSDIHLVYCAGATHADCYLLIAILAPDAHQQARSNNVMAQIGRAAELFRQKF